MTQTGSPSTSRGSFFLRSTTEEEVQESWDVLIGLFDEIQDWHTRVSDSLQVSRQSALGIADELSAPFQASHSVNYLRLTAVDHLHALRASMKDAQSQHIFAPFSLIRRSEERRVGKECPV